MNLQFFLINFIIVSVVYNNIIFGQTDIFEESISKDLPNEEEFIVILFFLFLLIGAAIWKFIHRTKERRYFSTEVKRQVLIDQNYKCAICKRSTEVWDYDHKDGNRSNNKTSNCQALCPNCHAKKTRGLLKAKEKSQSRVRIILIIIVIILFFVVLYYYNIQKNDILWKSEIY